MKINAITNQTLVTNQQLKASKVKNNDVKHDVKLSVMSKSYINFGWCIPHINAMKNLNEQFNLAVQKNIKNQEAAKASIDAKNLFKQTQYGLLDDASAKAAKLFAQYCNIQYSVAEMLPSYALSLNKPLMVMMDKMDGLNNPISTLITINNLTKLNMQGGIDKNTSKVYTPDQVKKAKAGTQLYASILLLDRVKQQLKSQNLDNSIKSQIEELVSILETKIDKIYGKNTLFRITQLSNIGENPTLEQKKSSIALIQEFDQKAQLLSLNGEFEDGLKTLIEFANKQEGKTIPNQGKGLSGGVDLKLSYHTHSHENVHSHEHVHHHHPEMTEEEHRLYHLREEQEKQRNQQKG